MNKYWQDDEAETLMVDGDWCIRRSFDGINTWVSHLSCHELPRKVERRRVVVGESKATCCNCNTAPPKGIMGFLTMVEWER